MTRQRTQPHYYKGTNRPSDWGVGYKNRESGKGGPPETDSTACPRYEAWSGADDFIECADNLPELLAILTELVRGEAVEEDIAVWDGCLLAAVVLGDGSTIVFAGDADVRGPFAGRVAQ